MSAIVSNAASTPDTIIARIQVVSTCIRIQVARPGYLYRATCISCKRGWTLCQRQELKAVRPYSMCCFNIHRESKTNSSVVNCSLVKYCPILILYVQIFLGYFDSKRLIKCTCCFIDSAETPVR